MVKPVTGRSGFAVVPGGASVPFSADPAPQPASATETWAFRQFEDLARVLDQVLVRLDALEALVTDLQAADAALAARVAALEGIVGDGSWDG